MNRALFKITNVCGVSKYIMSPVWPAIDMYDDTRIVELVAYERDICVYDNRKEKILPSSGGETTHPTGNTCSHIERTTDKESRAAYAEEVEERERWAKGRPPIT